MRILLVDDEVEISDLYARYLGRCGFPDIAVAHTSQAAIEIIERDKPDLVVLDISLGADSLGSGMDVLTRVRRTVPGIRVCMMSAYRDEHEKLSLDLGAFAFIAKPFKPDVLIEVIRTAQNGSEGE